MATFANIARGHRARSPVPFSLSGAKWDAAKADWDGETILVDVRVLKPADELEAMAAAAAYATKKGVVEPGEGDPIYDYALSVEKILRACVDHDSPVDAAVPFFESFDQIINDESISRDHVAYLAEQQELWQAECSPHAKALTEAEFEAAVVRTASGDKRDFLGWSLALRWSFTRSTAVMAAILQKAKSPSGSLSVSHTPTLPQ